MPMRAIPDTIDKATQALQTAAKPGVFPTLIALLAIAGVGYFVRKSEQRADAQILVMQEMAAEMRDLRLSFKEAGIKIAHHEKPKVQTSGLGGSDE